MTMAFAIEMRRRIGRADEAYRDHVADCPTYVDGLGTCAECDRLHAVLDGLRTELREGPE